MKVLIVTNSDDPTVDFVERKFRQRSVDYLRFNTDQAILNNAQSFEISGDPRTSTKVALSSGQVTVHANDIQSIWYRRPVTPRIADVVESPQARQFAEEESLYYLRCLWKTLEDRVWVSHPWSISWANTKLHQLINAKTLGFTVPRSLATNDPQKALVFFEECGGKVIVKPFTVSSVEYGPQETVAIFTNRISKSDLEYLSSIRYCITFFQQEITKLKDVRVTVVGNDVYAASIDSQVDVNLITDWRRTTSRPKRWQAFDLPPDVQERCRKLVTLYGLNFGAIDLALTPDHDFVFFEINPNGQWAWLEIEADLPISQSLIALLSGV